MGAKPRYTEEFKEHVLGLLAKGRTPKRISDEYEGSPSPAVIYKWMRDAGEARMKELKRAIQKTRDPQATFGRYNLALKEQLQEEFKSGNCQPTDYYVSRYEIHSHTIRRWAREVNIRLPRTARDKPALRSEYKPRTPSSSSAESTERKWIECPDGSAYSDGFFLILQNSRERVALRYQEGIWYYRFAVVVDINFSNVQPRDPAKVAEARRIIQERKHAGLPI